MFAFGPSAENQSFPPHTVAKYAQVGIFLNPKNKQKSAGLLLRSRHKKLPSFHAFTGGKPALCWMEVTLMVWAWGGGIWSAPAVVAQKLAAENNPRLSPMKVHKCTVANSPTKFFFVFLGLLENWRNIFCCCFFFAEGGAYLLVFFCKACFPVEFDFLPPKTCPNCLPIFCRTKSVQKHNKIPISTSARSGGRIFPSGLNSMGVAQNSKTHLNIPHHAQTVGSAEVSSSAIAAAGERCSSGGSQSAPHL